ncbi:MAG: repressor LexA [Candidatus Handelsmanbacteria bacterium RIFCSPLOWO2_12_FULL_64_10]|uniref:LexA repressor n=1 Tax=Handelsmanbacteria sp. (strain RIFCSPLOWO2_12_FULL_64_10) TaxID=1817868 RepID=A0A1F6CQH9_HANXR|nr:MAG: repressor LexA [Candidatus Handelsmanbacteria bacterium RIFCSPLOWO2_12_FULL_64_10]
MRKKLTERQRTIYEFIVDIIRTKGYPPTIREIMEEFHIASTNGVRTTLSALAKKGYINRRPMLSRGIELTDFVERQLLRTTEMREVPIIGKVAAGEPVLAVENVTGALAVDRSFLPSDHVFALEVQGESMKNAGILPGDYVLARQQEHAAQGDIVVALVGDEATVKRYYEDGDTVRLMPENEAFQPILVPRGADDFRIAGKVVGLMRRF